MTTQTNAGATAIGESSVAMVDERLQAELADAFDRESLAALYDLFRRTVATETRQIDAAIAARDREALARAAHRLVSAASQFGFPRLAHHAKLLETAAPHGMGEGHGMVETVRAIGAAAVAASPAAGAPLSDCALLRQAL